MALRNRELFVDTDQRLNGVHYVERNAERRNMTRIPAKWFTVL